jgi:outer membrane protein TolC
LWLLAAGAGAQPLLLERVIQMASQQHPKMRGVELIRQLAEAKVTEKEGAFDPALLLGSEYLRYNSPSAPGKPKLADDHLLGVQIQDVAGWKLMTGYRLNRGEVKSPDSLTGQGGEFFLEFKLPVLRGLGTNEKQTALEQAKVGRQLAEGLARVVRLEVLLTASTAYWDWCAACTDMLLIERNLKLAEVRAGQVEARIQAGDLPRIDGVEAQQEVERRRETLEKARRNVQKSLFKLSLYLWNSQGQAESLPGADQAVLLFPHDLGEQILPGVKPPRVDLATTVDLGQAELQALQMRPELRQIQFEKEIVALDGRLAENDRLPALDLTLGPGLDMGAKSIGLSYKVGVQLTIPLATRNADGRIQGARIKSDKLELDQVLEIQRILSEVRDAASLVEASQARALPALRSLQLALQLEEAERIRFGLGDSTVFLVNQRERASLSEAQKLVEIWSDGLKGKALLEAAVGRL